MPETRHRLQLDFSEGAWEETEALVKDSGLTKKAEVIRHALRLFQWFLSQTREGTTLLIQKKDGETFQVAFPFWNAPGDPQGQGEGSGDGNGNSLPGQPDNTK